MEQSIEEILLVDYLITLRDEGVIHSDVYDHIWYLVNEYVISVQG